ncbi:MAG: 50S ribosomal protein L21 [Thermodesulfovibrionales bacterium]|nr:50S ribosomal protein L21 [Thermodesulfovibrionales bacterium]
MYKMYAIVETSGRQYRVSVGDEIVVDKISAEPESEITIDKVLMLSNDDKKVFGSPYLENVAVKAKVIKTFKGDKILVYRPRPKKAIRRLTGHRSHYTKLAITDIIGG